MSQGLSQEQPTGWRLFTDGELISLCRSGEERMRDALDLADPAAAIAEYERLEDAMRAFCLVYGQWFALTDGFILETYGRHAHGKSVRPERIAELAVRTGLDLEALVLGQQMCASDDNPVARDARQAIERGNAAEALSVYQRSERLLRDVHDFRREAVSDLLGYIYRTYGADALEHAMLYAAERGWWRESMPEDFALDPRKRLIDYAFMLSVGGFAQMRIEEQPERWILHKLVCGNCGRQVRERYGDGDWGLEVVTERGPLTFGGDPVTIYQSHLAIIHHKFAIDHVGAPWPAFHCRGLQAGEGGCRLYLYKDPADTPAEFYEMVDRRPPTAAQPV